MAMQGEMPDVLPYVPRIDLWYNANSEAGTLPKRHRGRSQDEISRAEGWALHKLIPEYLKVRHPDDTIHRALGIFFLKELVYKVRFPSDVEIRVNRDGGITHVEYHTPLGKISTTTEYTEEMQKSGASITWIKEHAIKGAGDYRILQYIFENLEVTPDYEDFIRWKDDIGEDGVAATNGAGQVATCPMHHIQKELLDATQFYLHYHDFQKEMRSLAEAMEDYYNQVLRIVADSPAEAVVWGANYDDMITYPSYFEKEIVPWIRKAADVLGQKDKVVICHCDGENEGLMDLIKDSGMQVAEAVTPFPMTKVTIGEYYERWSDKLTILGGIPECMLLKESTSEEDFEAYLDQLFSAVAPGKRLILGIGDTTPAAADFDRLVRIGERVRQQGKLPLKGGTARPVSGGKTAKTEERVIPRLVKDTEFEIIQNDILDGKHIEIHTHAQELLDRGFRADDILQRGMISAMEVISERFKMGDIFIPEVILSARVMNEGLLCLEPYLAKVKKTTRGKVLMATVKGDMHNIGKNMVLTMLRGVGFETNDMGSNVATDEIIEEVTKYKPDIVGLSALLTTTMPEMRKVIDRLEQKGLKNSTKIIVGGAPVNQKFADDIGADGYGKDAGAAVDLAKRLVAANV